MLLSEVSVMLCVSCGRCPLSNMIKGFGMNKEICDEHFLLAPLPGGV